MSFSETSSSKNKSKNTTQPSLEELYTTNNFTSLKRSIAEFTC